MAGDRSLLRSSALVAAGTLSSRVTGLARTAVLAWALGISRLADVYGLANLAPNLVYELLLGGVLSATLLPLFVEAARDDDDEASSNLVGVAFVTGIVLTIVGILLSQWVTGLFASALADDADATAQLRQLQMLLALLIPQVFFYALTTVCTAALNSRRIFGPPAFAPVLTNLVVIAALIPAGLAINGNDDILDADRASMSVVYLLGVGTTLGIAAMAFALFRPTRRALPGLRFRANFRHPLVKRMIRMSGWTFGYVAMNQVALITITALLYSSGSGGVAAYQTAFIFFQLPHGLFAVSIMTTFAPRLAEAATSDDDFSFAQNFAHGLRLLATVMVPASVGLALLARPLVAVLLERGEFGAGSAMTTARALMSFALGLSGFSLYLYVLRGFYARKDTRTPFFLNFAQNTINIAGAVLLAAFGASATTMALAYSASYMLAAAIALRSLQRRVSVPLIDAPTRASISSVALATVAMAGLVAIVAFAPGGDHGWAAILRLGVGVLAGGALYFAVATKLGVDELGPITDRLPRPLRNKLTKQPSSTPEPPGRTEEHLGR